MYFTQLRYLVRHLLIFFLVLFSSCMQLRAGSISNFTDYPAFCQLAVDNDDVFKNFKCNPIYQQILEHVSYELGLEYLNIIEKEYPEILQHLEKCRENDLLGNPVTYDYGKYGKFSPTTLRYMKVAGDLQKKFSDIGKMRMIEIGGGYGGQCKIISDLFGFAGYTLIDLPECSALSQKYLGQLGVENVSFINNQQDIPDQQFDLVISNYAFSEIDRKEQEQLLENLVKYVPNGYLTMNFISHHFNLTSLSLEELIRFLMTCGKIGKVEGEKPNTHPANLLFTWYTDKSSTLIDTLPSLIPSENPQTANAITYSFSGGRFGDNLLAYFHAKWMAYKYELPFIYKPFPYSNQLQLHDRDQPEGRDFVFQNMITFKEESDLTVPESSSLFTIPYFPETRNEYEWMQLYALPFYTIDWEDPNFREEVIQCLQPKNPVKTIRLPQKALTVALHIRRGAEASFYYNILPLKFAKDEYYIQQIRTLANIFPHDQIYIYLFTDDNDPEGIIKKYKKILNEQRISFDYNKVNGMLEDFYSIPIFDCCIFCQSNFSLMASKLGNYAVSISPVHAVMKDNQAIIDEVEIVFNANNKRNIPKKKPRTRRHH